MNTIYQRSEWQKERAQTRTAFMAVKPLGYGEAWSLWHTVYMQALADVDRRFYARHDGYDRLLISYRKAVTVDDYLSSPKAERLAA